MSENRKVFHMPMKTGRWIYVFIGLIINICLGSIYSWSIFKKPLEDLFEISSTMSGLPFMVFLVFFAGLMPFAGKLIDKYGPKSVTLIGGILVGLGWMLSGLSNNIYLLTLFYGVIAGSGVGIAYGGPICVATKWFPDKRGLAVGISIVGFGLSPFVTAPLTKYLIQTYDPLKAFGILGIVYLVVLIILSLLIQIPGKKDTEELNGHANKQKKEHIIYLKAGEMLRTGKFYVLWFCYIIGTLAGLMAIGISSPVGEEIIKLEADTAAIAVSLFAVFNGLGRPFFGWISDRFKVRIAAVIAFMIIMLSSLGMLFAGESDFILYLCCFSGFWFAFGGWLAIAPAATSGFFGLKYYSQNYGVVYTAYGVGALAGNLISGRIKDILGSYQYSFYPTLILAGIGIILAGILLKKKRNNYGKS